MSLVERFDNSVLIWFELIIILASGILHIVFGFKRKLPDFNIYDLFNASPLFDFYLSDICNDKSNNVFHTWGGWKRLEDVGDAYSWFYYDKTNITKINGKYFCYKYISYIDLLNNGQIIKNGTECPKEYKKNCGRIDTLNQELCIKENEKCPLYDAGIGQKPDLDNYNYDNESNIYYNNDNYNITNKTIMGKLILNEGQPCYQSTEKLWRQYSSIETDENHLKCTNIQINGKYNDDRFLLRGETTYKKIYDENLDEKVKNFVFNNSIGNDSVFLYKREFFGIDKKCDEKFNLKDDFNGLIKIQNIDKQIQCAEGIIIVCFISIFFFLKYYFVAIKKEILLGNFIFGHL